MCIDFSASMEFIDDYLKSFKFDYFIGSVSQGETDTAV